MGEMVAYRTDQQLQQARLRATEARRSRRDLRRQLAAGDVTLPDVIRRTKEGTIADVDAVLNMRVVDLVMATPRIGAQRATRLMDTAGIAHNRRMRGLGRHQAVALIAAYEQMRGAQLAVN